MANIAKDIIQLHVSKVSDPIWENVCIHFTFEDLKDGQTRKIMVKRQQYYGKKATMVPPQNKAINVIRRTMVKLQLYSTQ